MHMKGLWMSKVIEEPYCKYNIYDKGDDICTSGKRYTELVKSRNRKESHEKSKQDSKSKK